MSSPGKNRAKYEIIIYTPFPGAERSDEFPVKQICLLEIIDLPNCNETLKKNLYILGHLNLIRMNVMFVIECTSNCMRKS